MNAQFRPHRIAGIAAAISVAALLSCGDGPVETTPPPPPPPVNRTLTVQVDGFGEGRVTSNVGGIDCRTGGAGTCSATVQQGAAVLLTGTADAGFTFGGWSQACSGAGACTVTLNADATVGARFDNPRLRAASIGPAGGVLQSADGSLTLTVPAGALGAAATLTVEEIGLGELGPEFANLEQELVARRAYRLGPSGTTFAQPVKLAVLSDQVPVEVDGGIQYYTEALLTSVDGKVEALDGMFQDVSPDRILVEGEMGHFSLIVESIISGGNLFRLTITGVPEVHPAGEDFEVTTRIEGTLNPSNEDDLIDVTYTDKSKLPVFLRGGLTGALTLVQVNSEGYRFLDRFTYACAEQEGRGLLVFAVSYRIRKQILGKPVTNRVGLAAFADVDCLKPPGPGLEAFASILLEEPPAAVAARGEHVAVVGETTGRLDVFRIGGEGQIIPSGTLPGFCEGASSGFFSPFPGFQGEAFIFPNPQFGKLCIGSTLFDPPAYPMLGFTPAFGANIPGTNAFVVTRVNPPVGLAVYNPGSAPWGNLLGPNNCPGQVSVVPGVVPGPPLAILTNLASPAPGGAEPCGATGLTSIELIQGATHEIAKRSEIGTNFTWRTGRSDYSKLFVTDETESRIYVFDVSPESPSPLTHSKTIELPSRTSHIAMLPDDRTAVVTFELPNTVALIDTETGDILAESASGGLRPIRVYAHREFITVINRGENGEGASIQTFKVTLPD